MNPPYRATNGTVFTEHEYGLQVSSAEATYHIGIDTHLEDMAEYFQKRRDEKLGIWRISPESPWIIHPHGDSDVRAINELNGQVFTYDRRQIEKMPPSLLFREGAIDSVKSFCTVHPISKPWHEAETGEAWLIDTNEEGITPAVVVLDERSGELYFETGDWSLKVTDRAIKNADRLYPYGDDQ